MKQSPSTPARAKLFQQVTRSMGCVATRDRSVQLHHAVGRSYVQGKTPIGHWFVLPLTVELHDVHSNSEFNVTHHKHNFEAKYGTQVELWLSRLLSMVLANSLGIIKEDINDYFPPFDVIEAILGKELYNENVQSIMNGLALPKKSS